MIWPSGYTECDGLFQGFDEKKSEHEVSNRAQQINKERQKFSFQPKNDRMEWKQ